MPNRSVKSIDVTFAFPLLYLPHHTNEQTASLGGRDN